MKNKVIIGSLIATLFAFMLYTANIKQLGHASLQVIDHNRSSVVKRKNKKSKAEPKVAGMEYPSEVKVKKGSQADWAKKISQIMGKNDSYQVCLQDLNSPKFAQVANTSKLHQAKVSSRLFLLVTIYYQEQHGNLSGHSALKVKKADRVKGEKMLSAGIAYSVTYLKQAMLQGNQTATNVLMRKVGSKIAPVIKQMGATDTSIKHTTTQLSSQTTATDLARIMVDLYQDKTLDRQHANLALGSLNSTKHKPKLASGVNGTVYAIGDKKAAVILVQSGGHTYCLSVWSDSARKLTRLSKTVADFFN
ncbi:serine hydrolase [Lactobacillus sp. ESL0684]|uniref:serine hydrolase n=1 Tax=Lactobacillus sp. ESL0684 TaxID=2983213 RepID=UPI0023F623BD|nr:serine hydrolase [Lactobacillus sp. ESL0684]WEV43896.1 serine hydrolase [Lactobacillus sp. ESL0684]